MFEVNGDAISMRQEILVVKSFDDRWLQVGLSSVEWWMTAGGPTNELLGSSGCLDGRNSGFGRWLGLVGCSRESDGGGLVSGVEAFAQRRWWWLRLWLVVVQVSGGRELVVKVR